MTLVGINLSTANISAKPTYHLEHHNNEAKSGVSTIYSLSLCSGI